MIPCLQFSSTKKGFSLIESLVFLFIFMLISVVFLQVYLVGTRTIFDSKNRLGAVALANQKMEIIRSIEYADIGTKVWNGTTWLYGVPAGNILQQEDISINTKKYHVTTFVQYVDDAFDGKVNTVPKDTIPTDYKRVRIEVSWGENASQKVVVFGNFSPEGIESATSGGILSVNVLQVNGTGLSGATVNVQNSSLGISISGVTDASGNLLLPGMPASTKKYSITIAKNNYFGATTYPPYPTTSYTPVDTHATVVANALNQVSMIMDLSADIPLKTVDPFDQNIGSVQFNLLGGRILGSHPTTGVKTVTLNSTNQTTNASGEYTYTDQSYGEYVFSLGGSSSGGYELYKLLPETTTKNDTVDIAPGNTGVIKAVLLDKGIGSLKVAVVKKNTTVPIAAATVRLRNTAAGYDVTGTTDQFGWVYFPQSATPLVSGTYDVDISASGYTSESDSVSVGTTLVKKTIELEQ